MPVFHVQFGTSAVEGGGSDSECTIIVDMPWCGMLDVCFSRVVSVFLFVRVNEEKLCTSSFGYAAFGFF